MLNDHVTESTKKHLATSRTLFTSDTLVPFALVTALFFLWGIPNNLNDVLIRQFMKAFPITRLQAGLVQSSFYMGYFLLALPSAFYMRKAGFKAGFVTGLALFGVGSFLFWPAALSGRYWFFLLALFVMASGLAFLETASNTFIALSGSPETSERRLNFSQAFNPIGSIAGALIGTTFIFSGIELNPSKVQELQAQHRYATYIHFETLRVARPYIVLGFVAVVFIVLISRTSFPILKDDVATIYKQKNGVLKLLKNRCLLLAMFNQFLYVGAQVGTWSYFIQYVQSYTGQTEKLAGYFLTGTLIMFGVGRFLSAFIMTYIQPAKLMGSYCLVNIVLLSIAIFYPGWLGVWMIFITSFFMSLMYPTIFAMGLQGLGADSKVGGSLIVMMIVGGAVLTPLMGVIADLSKSLAYAYSVPLLGYVSIACYSFFATRPERS